VLFIERLGSADSGTSNLLKRITFARKFGHNVLSDFLIIYMGVTVRCDAALLSKPVLML
jgi:hypothetical protein